MYVCVCESVRGSQHWGEGTHVCVCGRVRGPPRGGERVHVCVCVENVSDCECIWKHSKGCVRSVLDKEVTREERRYNVLS